MITRLQTEVELSKQRSMQSTEKEVTLRSKQSELETKLEEKQKDNDRLEKMLELVRHECNAQVTEKVREVKRSNKVMICQT